jgi:hypothetical protein
VISLSRVLNSHLPLSKHYHNILHSNLDVPHFVCQSHVIHHVMKVKLSFALLWDNIYDIDVQRAVQHVGRRRLVEYDITKKLARFRYKLRHRAVLQVQTRNIPSRNGNIFVSIPARGRSQQPFVCSQRIALFAYS